MGLFRGRFRRGVLCDRVTKNGVEVIGPISQQRVRLCIDRSPIRGPST